MNTMMRVLSILLIALLSLIGCERQTNTPDNNGDNPPTYEGPYYITMTLTYLASSPPYPNDEVLATVRIVNRDSIAVPDSMDVHWRNSGSGVWLDSVNKTYSGIATNLFRIGSVIEHDTLIATFGVETFAVSVASIVYVVSHPPHHINFSGPQRHLAVANDTIAYEVSVFDPGGSLVRDTLAVQWSFSGRGSWLDPVTYTHQGIARNVYRLGAGFGTDSLRVSLRMDSTTLFATIELETNCGEPYRFDFTPDSIIGGQFQGVLAVCVFDSIGNCLQYPFISPNSPFGSVTPGGYNENGDTSYFLIRSGSVSPRTWWIRFEALNGVKDSILCSQYSQVPASIVIQSDFSPLQVRGVGGLENTILQPIVYDINRVTLIGVQVRFRITNSESFGNTPTQRPFFEQFGQDSIDVTIDENSYGAVTLSSGTRPGNVNVEATVLSSDPSHSRTNIHTTEFVTILPGPPATIDLSWDRSTTQSEGGGQVSVSINARVTDRYSNPVQDGIAVNYTMEPDTLASINPATTGNLSPTGIRVPGTAFSRMQYQSYNAFDTATVTAHIQSIDTTGAPIMITGTWREHLPLVNGQLVIMQLEPRTWTFSENGARAVHLFSVGVLDGYGQRIARAPIVFSTQRGRIYATRGEASRLPNGGVPMSPPRLRTGNYPGRIDSTGYGCATVLIGASLSAVFLDTTMQTVNSVVTAYLEGYGSIDQISDTIVYRR